MYFFSFYQNKDEKYGLQAFEGKTLQNKNKCYRNANTNCLNNRFFSTERWTDSLPSNS